MTTPHNPPVFGTLEEPSNTVHPFYYATSMTLRDLFVGFAMAGILANPTIEMAPEDAADLAGRNADAMLKERAK